MKGFLTSLVVLLVLVLPTQVFATVPFFYVVAPDGVNMTTTASEDGKIVVKLPPGTKVSAVEEETNWTRIDFNGRLGWVPSSGVKPFTENLWPVYAQHYATLQETEHVVYALVADFTQDGIEDLYIVTDEDTASGQYTESIYRGNEVIYQQTLTDGLTILRNGLHYYIRHDGTVNRDATFSLSELNEQAKTDYYEASAGNESYKINTNSYVQTIHIVQAKVDVPAERTFISEEITSKNYSGAEVVNNYNESVYLHRRAERVKGVEQELTEADFNTVMAPYQKARVVAEIYEDHYKSAELSTKFAFQKQRVLEELMNLAEAHQLVVDTELNEAELELVRGKLVDSAVLELPFGIERNEQQMIKRMLQLMAQQTGMTGEVRFNHELVLNQVRAFYGVKPEAELEIADVKLDGTDYVTTVAEQVSRYRQLTGAREFAKDFFTVQFTEYELPQTVTVDAATEKQLLAGKVTREGYILLKRVGEEWLYIDTVDQLAGMNMLHYEDYANELAAKEVAPVEKLEMVAPVEEPIFVVAEESAPEGNRSLFIGTLVVAIAFIFSFGLAYNVYVYKFKRK